MGAWRGGGNHAPPEVLRITFLVSQKNDPELYEAMLTIPYKEMSETVRMALRPFLCGASPEPAPPVPAKPRRGGVFGAPAVTRTPAFKARTGAGARPAAAAARTPAESQPDPVTQHATEQGVTAEMGNIGGVGANRAQANQDERNSQREENGRAAAQPPDREDSNAGLASVAALINQFNYDD